MDQISPFSLEEFATHTVYTYTLVVFVAVVTGAIAVQGGQRWLQLLIRPPGIMLVGHFLSTKVFVGEL